MAAQPLECHPATDGMHPAAQTSDREGQPPVREAQVFHLKAPLHTQVLEPVQRTFQFDGGIGSALQVRQAGRTERQQRLRREPGHDHGKLLGGDFAFDVQGQLRIVGEACQLPPSLRHLRQTVLARQLLDRDTVQVEEELALDLRDRHAVRAHNRAAAQEIHRAFDYKPALPLGTPPYLQGHQLDGAGRLPLLQKTQRVGPDHLLGKAVHERFQTKRRGGERRNELHLRREQFAQGDATRDRRTGARHVQFLHSQRALALRPAVFESAGQIEGDTDRAEDGIVVQERGQLAQVHAFGLQSSRDFPAGTRPHERLTQDLARDCERRLRVFVRERGVELEAQLRAGPLQGGGHVPERDRAGSLRAETVLEHEFAVGDGDLIAQHRRGEIRGLGRLGKQIRDVQDAGGAPPDRHLGLIQQDPLRQDLPLQEREDPQIDEEMVGEQEWRRAVGFLDHHVVERHPDVWKHLDGGPLHFHLAAELHLRLFHQQSLVIGAVQDEGKREDDRGDDGDGNKDQPRELSAKIPHSSDIT